MWRWGLVAGIVAALIQVQAAGPRPAQAQTLGALGGIVGVGGAEGSQATAATPLLTMTGNTALAEGSGVVGLQYTYTHLTRFLGKKIENQFVREFGHPGSVKADSRLVFLGYGITDRLSLGLGIPSDAVEVKETLRPGELASLSGTSQSGLGNIAAALKYQFATAPAVAGRVTVRLPSGFAVGAEATEVDGDLAVSLERQPYALHLQAGYQWTLPDRSNRKHSDSAVANLALARTVGEGFVGFIELNYLTTGGSLDPVFNLPAQSSLDLTPGAKVRIKDALFVAAAARVALVNDLVLGYDTSYLVTTGYVF